MSLIPSKSMVNLYNYKIKLLRVIVSVRSLIASLRSVIVINLDWKSEASSAHAWSDDKDFFLTRFVKHFLGLRSKMILINYSFFESLISYYGKNVWWIRWNWLLLCKQFLTVTLFRIAILILVSVICSCTYSQIDYIITITDNYGGKQDIFFLITCAVIFEVILIFKG